MKQAELDGPYWQAAEAEDILAHPRPPEVVMMVSSRTTNVLLLLVLASGIAIVAMLANSGRAGPLDPPQPPASTLPQVEPRSPIPPVGWNSAFPVVIDQPGSYFLTRNLEVPGGADGIVIAKGNVSLDLNGFWLKALVPASGTGIRGEFFQDIAVVGGGVAGFHTGVYMIGDSASVSNIRVSSFGPGFGISVGVRGRVEACEVSGSGTPAVRLFYRATMTGCSVVSSGVGVQAAGTDATIQDNVIIAGASPGGIIAPSYSVVIDGFDVTVRNNTISNNPLGEFDIGVNSQAAVIIDNVIHCPTSIVNLGAFSYTAPVNGEAHSNQPRYAAGFC